jgi:hypothetical protein
MQYFKSSYIYGFLIKAMREKQIILFPQYNILFPQLIILYALDMFLIKPYLRTNSNQTKEEKMAEQDIAFFWSISELQEV